MLDFTLCSVCRSGNWPLRLFYIRGPDLNGAFQFFLGGGGALIFLGGPMILKRNIYYCDCIVVLYSNEKKSWL